MSRPNDAYRGRLAPSPTGLLHLGHARTFVTAWKRSKEHGGTLVLRNEDLDPQRSDPGMAVAAMEDLRWLGICWDEGPDIGGPYAPYTQSESYAFYLEAWRALAARGHLYPCRCTRRELRQAASAPHEGDDGPLYPGTCRPARPLSPAELPPEPTGVNWRFRISEGETVRFHDGFYGPVHYQAGQHFGDFAVWRRDGVPAYQLAVVADDRRHRVTEVVRGADLLVSTARQLLLYRALGWTAPEWYHCPLVTDEQGHRLAKRTDALSIRALRASGKSPAEVLALAGPGSA